MSKNLNYVAPAEPRQMWGASLAVSLLIMVEGFSTPINTPFQTISLACFAMAIPLGIYGWLAQGFPKKRWLGATIGMLAPGIGLALWLWERSPAATVAFLIAVIWALILYHSHRQ